MGDAHPIHGAIILSSEADSLRDGVESLLSTCCLQLIRSMHMSLGRKHATDLLSMAAREALAYAKQ